MKKQWTQPTLTVHGSVEELTRAACAPVGSFTKTDIGVDDLGVVCYVSSDSEI